MKQAEPRHCIACGINRRAKPGHSHCYDCMPGGPFTPPPCRRCGTTENFFASGLCARCHLHGTIRVGSCLDCRAWGTSRHGGWLCRGCQHWRRLHTIGPCLSCDDEISVNARCICRLCWKNASGARVSTGEFDPIGPNRHGQQLFFADMHKAAAPRRPPRPPIDAIWPAGRPVAHRQLILLDNPRDFSRGRRVLPQPRDAELAAALDAIAVTHGHQRGWTKPATAKVRAGIRTLLGLQDTPGAPIRRTETAVLPALFITIRPVVEVLETVGMIEDDRTPAIDRWFNNQIIDLPTAITNELRVWFDVMRHGSTSPPRRRPRSDTTIKLYTRPIIDSARAWETHHDSLREITRADVFAVLPSEVARRKIAGQAMRSLFGILKGRKLVFTNPATNLAHASDSPIPPAVADIDAVRQALNSSDRARAALTALVAFHGLRSGQLRHLKLTDIRDRRLHLDSRVIPLANPVRQRIAAWLDERNRRWPTSTNPHLFIHFRTAHRDDPVGGRWVFLTLGLPGGAQAIRQDRILHEAIESGGDPRRLCDLFGLSIQHATRYTDAISEPVVERT